MLGTSMFPCGGAPQGSARLLALGVSAALLLIPAALLCRMPAGAESLVPARSAGKTALPALVYRVIMLLLCACFALRCSYMLSLYAGMIELYLLPRTPSFAVIAALLLTSLVIDRGGSGRLLRICELVVMSAAIPAAILTVNGLYRSDFGEWLILLQPDREYVPGLLGAGLVCCSGLEYAFFFIGGDDRRAQNKALLRGFAATCALAALSYLLCAGILTVEGTEHMNYPLVETARVINIGGVAFTNRYDLLLMVISIALLPAHIGIALHCAASCARIGAGRPDMRISGWLMLVTGGAAWLGQYAQYSGTLRALSVICCVFTMFAALPAVYMISRIASRGAEADGRKERSV